MKWNNPKTTTLWNQQNFRDNASLFVVPGHKWAPNDSSVNNGFLLGKQESYWINKNLNSAFLRNSLMLVSACQESPCIPSLSLAVNCWGQHASWLTQTACISLKTPLADCRINPLAFPPGGCSLLSWDRLAVCPKFGDFTVLCLHMAYNPSMYAYSVCKYFITYFWVCVHQRYWPGDFCCCYIFIWFCS